MKTTLTVVGIVLAAAIGVAAYLHADALKSFVSFGSAAGSSFNSAKVAAININPRSITSTSTSLYNSDASDRIVTDAFVTCSGLTNMFGATSAGLSTYQWYAATSSVPAPTASVANVPLAAMNTTVATSSDNGYTATTTYTNAFARRWNSGTYMIFQTNGTSSAATCQAGVHYLAL